MNSSSKRNKKDTSDFSVETNELNHIKKVIGIVSGKGGVGKSIVTSMLAVIMRRKGYKIAIMDADVTGPSIPKSFGIHKSIPTSDIGMLPLKSKSGIEIMSINLLLKSETDPVVWRGPRISALIKQFWKDVIWQDIDYMFIDLPPGTADASLTVFQSIKVDGIIVVTSPQELVSMIVSKSIKMAGIMNIPIIGIIENMSWFTCPCCGNEYHILGESKIKEICDTYNIKLLGRIPILPELAAACDNGEIENFKGKWLDEIPDILEKTKT